MECERFVNLMFFDCFALCFVRMKDVVRSIMLYIRHMINVISMRV